MKEIAQQNAAPLIAELQRYTQKPLGALHTPGHKAGRGLEPFWFEPGIIPKFDLTEITAFAWQEAWLNAEILAADFYQAARSFFLVQGATQGVLAALMGVFRPGETILVARNCHLAVIHGLILADLKPIFLPVDYLTELGITSGLELEVLSEALENYPEAKGLLITNPTYQGIAFPVKPYRELLGDRLLIIDEAHGGYLGWTGYPDYEAKIAADLWIQGTHKMLGSLTQTGLLHLGSRIDPSLIERSLKLVTTTSPSYLLLAALDSNRHFLATGSNDLFQEALPSVHKLRTALVEIPGLLILNEQALKNRGLVDPWRLCLSFRKVGYCGDEVELILQKEFSLQPEYADFKQVTFLISPWQESAELERLCQAVKSICNKPKLALNKDFGEMPRLPMRVMTPRQAALGSCQTVHLEKALGRVMATVLAPYPPGISLLIPGELISEAEISYLTKILDQGGIVQGVSAEKTILVTTED